MRGFQVAHFPVLKFKILAGQPSTLPRPLFLEFVPHSWQLTSLRQKGMESAGWGWEGEELFQGKLHLCLRSICSANLAHPGLRFVMGTGGQ